MEITISNEKNYRILKINGDVDASSAIQVDEQIRMAIDENFKHILIDCEHLEYISSAGLGVFMSYLQELKIKDYQMTLYNMNDKVFKVFEILGLHNLITIVDTKEEALT